MKRLTHFAAATLLTSAATITAVAASSGPAAAASTGCSGNVCIYLAGNAGGDVLVQAWARNNNFNGYFTLSGPNSVNKSSGTTTWRGGKGNYWSTTVPAAGAGTYCITGNPGQGTACNRVT